MATHPQRVQPDLEPDPPIAAQPDAPAGWRIFDALQAKLAELRGKGHDLLWIECCQDDLTALVLQGGEDALELDDDPSVDRAWFDDVEIRLTTTRNLTWVFLKGEDPTGQVSAHVIGPPDPPPKVVTFAVPRLPSLSGPF